MAKGIGIILMLFIVSGCDDGVTYDYVTDKQKEERLFLECLKAIKVDVRAGDDATEDAITSCQQNASTMSSEMVITKRERGR